jgi:acyl carrier protein
MTSIEASLFSLIARELRLGNDILSRDTRPSDIPTWDSLSNALVFVAIQKDLCEDISFDSYTSCSTLGELADLLDHASNL